MADFRSEYEAQRKAIEARQAATGNYRSPGMMGVELFGEADPDTARTEYGQRVAEAFGRSDRKAEQASLNAQRQRILGAMQPSNVATEAARAQAMQGAQATVGAARSQAGVAGTQTAGLAALGAGQAQQAGMVEARQVQAQEAQRNALAQAQLAEMLRQQELARMGLERADYAQILGAQRALLPQSQQFAQEAATAEAARQRQLLGATVGGLAAIGEAGYDAYKMQQREAEAARSAYNRMTEDERRRRYGDY